MPNENISFLYDHYKDTCSIVGLAINRRDRLMMYVIVALALFAFQAFFPSVTSQTLDGVINLKLGLDVQSNLSAIGSALWFLLLIFTLRYFQTSVFIERQYKYLHQIEDKLNKEIEDGFITREGKGYLSKYPVFSDWMWILYTLVFPLLLFGISLMKIASEWVNATDHLSLTLLLNSAVAILLAVSIVLYLGMLHFKNKEK